jgi:DNA topoisomerase-2
MSNVAAYKKHTHREHILELPDTYIGSIDTHEEDRWVWEESKARMNWTRVKFCPGFYKLFDEVLVNALDHRVRLITTSAGAADVHPVKNIWVTVEPTRITVRNDGDGIPTDKHPTEGMHVPEMIFGHLLTSSNYDKTEEKTVGGKNGYGAKLANIFSKEFTVGSFYLVAVSHQ